MISEHLYHRDSFGQMQSVLTGGSQWTLRLVRGTKVAVPHIAKTDVFTYKCQLNHDKKIDENIDSFHIHILPIGAVTGGEKIALDYAWGWLTDNEVFPNTLPQTGTAYIDLVAGDQYKYLIKSIVSDIAHPTSEGYSSEFFIQCTRRNDGEDTYAGEFALLDGDVHYPVNKIGSYSEYNDEPEVSTTTTTV